MSCILQDYFQFKTSGLRLLGSNELTDLQEAGALSHENDIIEIYSNSWGPFDSGDIVEGPGPLVQMAFEMGAREVRLYTFNGAIKK